MQRIVVSHACSRRCTACVACRDDAREVPASAALALLGDELVLGGGDATRWPSLHAVLDESRGRVTPRRLWIEAPARAFAPGVLEDLRVRGAFGVVVQIEAYGERMEKALGAGDGLAVLRHAESLGLATQARVCVRPRTLPIIGKLAEELAPRLIWLEIASPSEPHDQGHALTANDVETLERVLLAHPHVSFTAYRMIERGYFPPCTMPELWKVRPSAWATALSANAAPNASLTACGSCALATRCRFAAVPLLPPEVLAQLVPVGSSQPSAPPSQKILPRALRVTAHTRAVKCTAPFTTLEIVDPDGLIRQCCSDWTLGARGNVDAGALTALWNGASYRAARRAMFTEDEASICRAICPRLHDGRLAASALRIVDGSEAFVKNQLEIAEDIAEGRDELRGRPLFISLAASTYCNYDCIMCDHGRTPRRELPERVFDELPTFFPTLHHLTLLGGEPLAHGRTMQLLREVDGRRFPDLSIDFITNGSLLTPATLKHLRNAALGNITLSVNAGTDAVYQEVQRGISLPALLANLDGLLAFRAEHFRSFGVTLSFVIQPPAMGTLIAFGELARARGLPIRLLPLNVDRDPSLDFYGDPDRVATVLEALDRFVGWAAPHSPRYVEEARAARAAIAAHVAEASRSGDPRRLPIAH